MRYYVILLILLLLIIPACTAAEAPAVTGIEPAIGFNTTTVSITNLTGTNFTSGATVILTPGTVSPVHKGSIVNGAGGAVIVRPLSIFVSGIYAYVASAGDNSMGSNALEIVDVSNPAAPTHKGKIVLGPVEYKPNDVFVSGNYSYMTIQGVGANALEIVDVSSPANPLIAGEIKNLDGGAKLNNPRGVYVSGTYAYVASAGSNALEIVDVSNPAAPVHKGSIIDGAGGALLENPQSVYVSGNYAYVASFGSNALEIVDVSNPAAPTHKGSIENGGQARLSNPNSVYVSGNYAYVASYDSNALEIIDVSNPAAPTHKGSIVNGDGGARLWAPVRVHISGNYAYIASTGYSVLDVLEIVDVSNPAAPVHTGSIEVPNLLQDVYVSGSYAYLVGYSNALEIIDIHTVTATNVTVGPPTRITCTLDLIGKPAGPYNVVVTNPDGNFGRLASGFTVAKPDVPIASFIGSPTSGVFPLTVTFEDRSTRYPTSWNWSFGDGNFNTSQNPTHTFASGGVYTVSLNVTNAQGSNTLTRPDYIGVTFTVNDGIAIFRPSTGYWYFDNNLDAIINSSFRYGGSTDQIITGDWLGTGRDGIAIFRPSTGYWYFDYNLDGIVDKSFRYGGSTDQIIKGDWQGTGRDGIAIFRPSTGYWYFDYNLDGIINQSFRYGGVGDQIVKGDWQGTGRDGIAIFRPSTGYWYFDYNLDGIVDKSFRYGGSTDQIIVGKWQGTGRDGIAIFRPSTGYWYFDYNLDGIVNQSFRYGGVGDQIVKGDWQGTGRDGIAIFRPSTGYWYFDNYLDGIVDKSFRYGGSTDRIIAGKWISVAPTAAFVANITLGRSPLTVQFTDQSTGSPIAWNWDFGDGTNSKQQNPVHTYTSHIKKESYTVSLTVTNAFGSNTGSKSAYITISKK